MQAHQNQWHGYGHTDIGNSYQQQQQQQYQASDAVDRPPLAAMNRQTRAQRAPEGKRSKVDSVASLNDIAARDHGVFPSGQGSGGHYHPAQHQQPTHSAYAPPPQLHQKHHQHQANGHHQRFVPPANADPRLHAKLSSQAAVVDSSQVIDLRPVGSSSATSSTWGKTSTSSTSSGFPASSRGSEVGGRGHYHMHIRDAPPSAYTVEEARTPHGVMPGAVAGPGATHMVHNKVSEEQMRAAEIARLAQAEREHAERERERERLKAEDEEERRVAKEMSLKRKQAEQDARLKGKATTKQSDITISFRPKVNLKTGETVQLKLAEFESSGDFSGAQVTSIPAGAFVTASWSFQDRVLTLWLGSDVPADEQVTVLLSATAGLRRTSKNKQGQSANAENPAGAAPGTAEEDDAVRKQRAAEKRRDFLAAMAASKGPAPPSPPKGVDQVGVGLDFSMGPAGATVCKVVENGAAWQTGCIGEGDIITHVNGVPLAGMPSAEVAGKLLGEPLSLARLTVVKEGKAEREVVSVTRLPPAVASPPRHDYETNGEGQELQEELEEEFFDIPDATDYPLVDAAPAEAEVEVEKAPMTQMEWARQLLKREEETKDERITRTQVDSSHVAEQARWAKESLREVEETADERITRTELDRENVAEQAKWAVESLQSRQAEEVKVEYDAAAVAEQAQWAKESLEKREQSVRRTEFDAASVGEQAKWAMESLMNRGQVEDDEEGKEVESRGFDASKVAEQAAWARERLQGGGGDSPSPPPDASQRNLPLSPLAEAGETQVQGGGSSPPPAIISPMARAPSPPASSSAFANVAAASVRRSVTPAAGDTDDDAPLPPPRRRSPSPLATGLDESSALLPPLQAENRSPQTVHDLTAEESLLAELQDGLTEDERAKVMQLTSPK